MKIHTGVTKFTHLFGWWILSIWGSFISYSFISFLCRKGANALSLQKGLLFFYCYLASRGPRAGASLSEAAACPLPRAELPSSLCSMVRAHRFLVLCSGVLDPSNSGTECFVKDHLALRGIWEFYEVCIMSRALCHFQRWNTAQQGPLHCGCFRVWAGRKKRDLNVDGMACGMPILVFTVSQNVA